jgi:hypothetical protein
VVALSLLFAASCKPWVVPASLVGTWTGRQAVTVRVRSERGSSRFVSDTVAIVLSVRADGSVGGRIGRATLENAYVLQNRGWLGRALHFATDFRLEGRLQDAVFAGDPIPTMDIRAPFGLVGDTLAGTVFQRSGMGVYPMVELRLARDTAGAAP